MARILKKNMLCLFSLMCLVMMVERTCAREFTVGGQKGWSIPSDSQMFNQWAERNRFQIGDSLSFVYSSSQDSVLQVTKEDYSNCNTNSPIAKFADGHTSFTFNSSGPYYFISGNKDNCLKNEKLHVIVMADRTKSNPSSPPAPAPSGAAAPSPPAPAPATVEITPTPMPPPTPESPKSAAPSLSGSCYVLLSSIGALLGASMVSSMIVPFF